MQKRIIAAGLAAMAALLLGAAPSPGLAQQQPIAPLQALQPLQPQAPGQIVQPLDPTRRIVAPRPPPQPRPLVGVGDPSNAVFFGGRPR